MGVDLPPVTSAEISSEFQKPQAQEVVSVGECKSPDFQKQFDELQSQTKEKTAKLQEEMQYSEKQKEVLRKIYCSLGEENPELKKSIETQSVKIFEVPNRDLVALSVDGTNVDYLYNNDGNKYMDFKSSRDDGIKYSALLGFSDGHFNEIKNCNKYQLKVNDRLINSFSEEGLIKYSEWADYLRFGINRLGNIINEW